MDALILCGGFATRLEPITLFMPKPLLPIGGRPLLDHIIDSVASSDVDKIVIATNKRFADQFEYWMESKISKGFGKKLELVVEPSLHNNTKFGAIKGIKYAIEKANLNDDLLIVAGDNYYDFSIMDVINEFNTKKTPTLCVYDVSSIEEAKKFGVIGMENGVITDFSEKPSIPKSTIISTGIYVFDKEQIKKIDEYLKDGNNPDSPGYFIQWLIKNTKTHGVVGKGTWIDIGTIDSYKKVFALKHKEDLPD